MRIATILAACSTAVLAQSTAEQYPYGYWDVNVTSACTDGCVGYLKNFTIVFHDDNRIVSDEQKEYHCYSSWAADTLVETKKCDNQYLDFVLADKTIWTQTYFEIFQHFYWGGRGEPYPAVTVRGGVNLRDSITYEVLE
ncbi:hypothetical protein SLS57_002517 [Botryosphaeria dothidea]